ncbi:Mce protein [Mycobacterium sp. TNTM28]|uniref:Mce protein n=1 Tax=[Mycobacterium] fortunisiensis TaxID=2600579 RepID=A0ABS6KS07_9MYCO|nr:Mce protein [[Mycobacterium] fortunisiensis]MBU9766352.1 Mce protein [[Mycobacterium] fortunisiensis]
MADDSADAEPVEPTGTDDVAAEETGTEAADEARDGDSEETGDEQADDSDDAAEPAGDAEPTQRRFRRLASAGFLGTVLVVALAALVGWLGYGIYQVHQEQQRRAMFVDTARQGATDLTTIDWEHAEADVQRVLDISTGGFYDDFEKRSKSFLEVVKQIKSKSTGTVTASGLESYTGDEANVLVSVTVRSTNAGVPEQEPQVWRMELTVQDVAGKAKVSDVRFIQ